MYIPSKNVALVEVPKCASRSLTSAVSSSFPTLSIGNHATLAQYKSAFPELCRGFAVIRDPLERLKSAAQYLILGRGSRDSLSILKTGLDKSLGSKRPGSPYILLYPQYSFLVCHAPVRLYTMGSIVKLLRDLGIESQPPFENKSHINLPAEDVASAFGEDFIREFYAIDFALHNHLVSCEGGVMDVDDAKDYLCSLR
jgi:hypothetical protein